MDNSDPLIELHGDDGCNHCISMKAAENISWFTNSSGLPQLEKVLGRIRDVGRHGQYDCLIGLSGGIDSCYLAMKAVEWNLRPLLIHVDGGWNSELAVANIQALVDYTGWDLHTHVIEWNEMKDLQIAYLKSGISNQDVPQDHAFFAALYGFAAKNNIRHILSGGNVASEGIFPISWHGPAMDSRSLLAIHKLYGERELRTYPTISFFRHYLLNPYLKRIRTLRPLNFIPYRKAEAVEELVSKTRFKPYARKHGESIFTRFFQEYYLPKRFGIDKRIAHLSSFIISHQTTRDQAMQEFTKPLYEHFELKRDIEYIGRKLDLGFHEMQEFLTAPERSYNDFANWNSQYQTLKQIQKFMEKVTGKNHSRFS
jgi:N-acetyl sugar amidotransferase